MSKTRIYAGNFPSDIREREIEDLFEKVRQDCGSTRGH